MMKTAVIFTFLVLSAVACKKPSGNTATDSGKGGNATIAVTPEHHGEFVDTCTVYIKYNTLDAPASGLYDDSAICVQVNATPTAKFSGLKNGNYYLLAKGYHALYTPPYVKGGMKYTITYQSAVSVVVPTYSYLP